MSTEPAIAADGLRKRYPGGVEALRGISFAVAPGEVFALLGPNGAGKSTTIRILSTLSAADAGTARVAGFDVAAQPHEVRRRIGVVAQASGVDNLATGRENLDLQGRIFGLAKAERRRRTEDLLALLGLSDAADRLVRTYSGGMKRRLDVAIGLVPHPQVLFLDEPTTGLDPESRTVMWGEIRRLAAEGLSILLTTHYLEEADQLARRVAIVDRGEIVAAGTPEELKGRLRGDLLALELRDPARVEAARALLAARDDVLELVVEDGRLYTTVEAGARRIAALVGALEAQGMEVEQVTLSRPSLDDVYLEATGHAYREQGEAGAGAGAAGAGGAAARGRGRWTS
jgi:ABC-2 type transport system ATP-binding protein